MSKIINQNHFLLPEDVPTDLIIETIAPRAAPSSDESLEFHAARLLLLLRYGGGQKNKIIGRTKLAKLDFFIRYPTYLAKALNIESEMKTGLKPESNMIRYKYGPWDENYYNIFAYLVSKGLIRISPSKRGDVFQLTERGMDATEELDGPDFQEIIERILLVFENFRGYSGTALKKLIYSNFPEIVAKPLGSEIEP